MYQGDLRLTFSQLFFRKNVSHCRIFEYQCRGLASLISIELSNERRIHFLLLMEPKSNVECLQRRWWRGWLCVHYLQAACESRSARDGVCMLKHQQFGKILKSFSHYLAIFVSA